jgi:predicted nucleic acid-binding protein
MSAFSGGQASIEEHRRLGGNPHVDMAFLYLKSYFLTKKESEDVSERYSSGAMLSGEMKNMLFEKVIERINKLKEAYEKVDELYKNAEMGNVRLYFSIWNLGETVGVFDKHRKTTDPKLSTQLLLSESMKLLVAGSLSILDVSSDIITHSIDLVLKHHIYIADALQIATARKIQTGRFATADKLLSEIAEKEGFKVIKLKG